MKKVRDLSPGSFFFLSFLYPKFLFNEEKEDTMEKKKKTEYFFVYTCFWQLNYGGRATIGFFWRDKKEKKQQKNGEENPES